MTRVIGGVARGRSLTVPAGAATRPTADRAREGLFSTLVSLRGDLHGASFLDLYAGSGAVGIEAASRGATRVLLVERDPRALRAMRANLATLDLPGAEIRADRVERVLAGPPDAPYDVVFLDPPYAEAVGDPLTHLVDHRWLAVDAVVCVERASRDADLCWPAGLLPLRSRKYGEGMLWYGRRS